MTAKRTESGNAADTSVLIDTKIQWISFDSSGLIV